MIKYLTTIGITLFNADNRNDHNSKIRITLIEYSDNYYKIRRFQSSKNGVYPIRLRPKNNRRQEKQKVLHDFSYHYRKLILLNRMTV